MSNKNIYMGKIKQILLQDKAGVSQRQIARNLGVNRETVGKYIKAAKADTMGVDGLLGLDETELERRLNGGTAAYSDRRHDELSLLLPGIEEEIRKGHRKGVTVKLLWEEYRREHPDGYGLTQFRHHYGQYLGAGKSVSTVLKDLHVPGQAVYLDFAGNRMHYVDSNSGEMVAVEVFVASMPFSDYGFALAVPSQRSEDFVHALSRLMEALGGVPAVLVPDNLKAAVVKSDRHEPEINGLLSDFASHYGCMVQPARVRHPKDKSTVENTVKLVYQRVYAPLRNTVFHSLEELNAAIAAKMRDHNQRRMQGNGCTREELFLSEERPRLLPLPKSAFEILSSCELTVGRNCCVYLGTDKHYYSVPCELVGNRVRLVYTRSLVRIYHADKCIATHRRDCTPGRYTIDPAHLPPASSEYRSRNVEYYIGRAAAILPELGEMVELLFATTNQAEQALYKGCDAMLHLARETPRETLLQACRSALLHGKYGYWYFKGFVAAATDATATPEPLSPPPAHENIRGSGYYS